MQTVEQKIHDLAVLSTKRKIKKKVPLVKLLTWKFKTSFQILFSENFQKNTKPVLTALEEKTSQCETAAELDR